MSVLVDKNSRIICQGLTGRQGSFHAEQCMEYGTQIVAGVNPKKAGSRHEGLPVYGSVKQAAELMVKNNIHHLVVVEDGSIKGIVSSIDILSGAVFS